MIGMYHADWNLRPENIYVSEIKYQKYQVDRILILNIEIEKIAVLQCENAKKNIQARSHIHTFVQC